MPEKELPICQSDVTINEPRKSGVVTGYILCAQDGCEDVDIDFSSSDSPRTNPNTRRSRTPLTRAQYAGASALTKACPNIKTCIITENIQWSQMPVALRPRGLDHLPVSTNVI